MVARRPAHRLSGLSRQHLEHLDDESRRLRAAAGNVGPVRRSRAALVARRPPPRVFVGPQRHLRRLDAHARHPGRAADHRGGGQRVRARVVARWPRDRVRLGSLRARRLRDRGGLPRGAARASGRAHACGSVVEPGRTTPVLHRLRRCAKLPLIRRQQHRR